MMDPYYDIGKQNFQSAKASCLIRLSVVRKLSFHENCDELWRYGRHSLLYHLSSKYETKRVKRVTRGEK